MRGMRSVMVGVLAVGVVQGAAAADLGPILRGAFEAPMSAATRWNGVYFGGHFGSSISGTDFANATGSLVAFMLRNTTIENEQHVSQWTTLGKGNTTTTHYGGFAGYNMQWDDAVVGIEASYSRTNATMSQSDVMRRLFTTSDSYNNDVQVTAASSLRMTDYGTLRIRGGWAFGCFLPYAFVGAAIGRGDIVRTATVDASGTSTAGGPPYAFSQTLQEANMGAVAYGYTAGIGMDVALMQNVFIRGEWEYVQFGNFHNLNTHIHSLRGAVGIKF